MGLMDLRPLFSPPSDPTLLATGHYDPWLVTLSVAIAIFASWTALHLTADASEQRGRGLRHAALITGSLSLGAGVWAMHFIGMLAFSVCAVRYDPATMLWSALPSIGASTLALWLIGRRNLHNWQLILGGIAVGSGIGAMHYTGMAAMRMAAVLRYDPFVFGLSIIVAVALAIVALSVRFGLRRAGARWSPRVRSIASAVVMGLAIAGMHYTGMAAARFVGVVPAGSTTNVTFIAIAISAFTAAFTALVTAANSALRHREMFRRLQESESRLRALLATAPDGVVAFDAHGTIEDCNASAEEIFACARWQIIGHDLHALVRDVDGSSLESAIRDHPGREREAMALRSDGTQLPIRLTVGYGRLVGRDLYVGFIADSSERRAMEQALRDSERQLRALIGNIPGMSYRFILNGPAVFISDAVERLTGYPAADFMGSEPKRRWADLVHPEDALRVKQSIDQAIADNRPYTLEYRLFHRDGRERWMWGNGCPVQNGPGEPLYLDGVVLDLTERRHMEIELRAAKERAEQAAAARAAFLANMSHEIRTPMNSIIGFSEVLLQGELAAEQRRHLKTISTAARSLLRLLNGVLDTAKLDKGLLELEMRSFNLLEVVDEVSSTLGSSARDKGLALHVEYERELSRSFRGDALRIKQVMTNLVGNAIKFTPAGSITLAVSRQGEQVHIAVSDTGIGIAADRLEAIFDPFTQADPSMSRRYGGTGLGTTISKQLVELMGGRIWVESTLGKGSCFHVLLPLQATEETREPTLRVRRVTMLRPLRILAVDDAPQNLELVTLLLGGQGHTIVPAHNGAEAVELAAEQYFDVVLMDVQMPGLDGLSATRKIRAQEAARGAPRVAIIALSASVLSADRRAAAEAGMDAFASKPIDLAELTFEIARALGLHEHLAAPPRSKPSGVQLLDVERGLARWGGHAEPYLRALRHFAAEYAKLPTLLSSYNTFGGASEARALAHRVKGSAANLGLESLAALLEEFELALGGEITDAVPPLLVRLRDLMADSLASIEFELARAPPPAGTRPMPQPIDLQHVRGLAQRLQLGLSRGELDSVAFAQLTAALSGHVSEAQLDELQRIVDDFDFVLARTRLDELCAQFELPLAAAQS